MENYKEEIINSRKGCFGGSDGNMLSQIANLGYVPKSAVKRMAVCKGLAEVENVTTRAMEFGDEVENAVYKHLCAAEDGKYAEMFESNPLWVSKRYSKKNCKLICHPDIVRKDKESHTIFIYECKATKYGVKETKYTYRSQMFIEMRLGQEIAANLGGAWKVKLFLVHYNTYELDINQPLDFDVNRLTVSEVRLNSNVFDINKAMDICDNFLANLDYYSEEDTVDATMLPDRIKTQFTAVTSALREIKEREKQVEEFKEKLYGFLTEKGIKKVSCDDFSFTVVPPSTQVTFDHKKYLDDYEKEHPRVARKIREKYKKVSNKRGYVTIKVADNKQQ